jgi:hypothetical protein
MLTTSVKRISQTSYDGAEWLVGLAVTNLGFVGRTVDSDVDLRRADFWVAICVCMGECSAVTSRQIRKFVENEHTRRENARCNDSLSRAQL